MEGQIFIVKERKMGFPLPFRKRQVEYSATTTNEQSRIPAREEIRWTWTNRSILVAKTPKEATEKYRDIENWPYEKIHSERKKYLLIDVEGEV